MAAVTVADMTTAAVVGAGPNGLSAAIVLARAGLDVTVYEAAETIGGGTRSAELTLPGLVHDVCSAIHPTGIASPFWRSLDLGRHGLEWVHPAIPAVHLVSPERAAVLHADVDSTAAGLGADGDRWRRIFGPLIERADELAEDILSPMLALPSHPASFGRFMVRAGLPVSWATARWSDDRSRALLASLAAHLAVPTGQPATMGAAMMFALFAQARGWPAARGGSQAIAEALAAELLSHGGRIVLGHRVTALPEADLVMLDTTPGQALDLVGHAMPARVRRAFGRWRHGPGSHKIDLAVRGGVPWIDDAARAAGTVHLGGTLGEVDAAERAVRAGQIRNRPFAIVTQQYLADPGRSVDDLHPVWAYMHVPNGDRRDASEVLLAALERHAPGLADRIEACAVRGPAELEADNPNYQGGDITGGDNSLRQTVFRPRLSLDPYRITDRVYLCSSSASPGGGAHGMVGFHAATRAVSRL